MSTAAQQSNVLTFDTREAWLQARRNIIGASDSAGIFGVGYATQSPLTIWQSKVDPLDDEDETERLAVGRMIEPSLRDIFSYKTGLKVDYSGPFTLHVHPDYPWLGASLDGETTDDDGPAVVELKNVDAFLLREWQDEPPLKFQIQANQQMFVRGVDTAYIFGLIGGNKPVVKKIHRDDAFIQSMLPHLEKFWSYVVNREMPPVDGSAATTAAIKLLWPKDDGSQIDLPGDALEWDAQLVAAKAAKKAAEEAEAKYSNLLRAAIADASHGVLPNGVTYSNKLQKRAECIVKASEFRVLRRSK